MRIDAGKCERIASCVGSDMKSDYFTGCLLHNLCELFEDDA